MSTSMVVYQTDSGAEVKLSPSIIRNYLVNGDGKCSDQEIMMFLMLCKQQRLDPFLREAYLIKYGSNKPATMVTGKEVFTKRAERHPDFRGMVAGIVVQSGDSGALTYRPGSLVLKGESLVGGWAKVWKAEREVPYENAVSFDEYVGKKANGEINRQWSSKPATMIRKVALVQTLRETFPETFSGMYDADEMSHVQSDSLDESPVDAPKDVTPEEAPSEPVEQAEPDVSTPIGKPVTIEGGDGDKKTTIGTPTADDERKLDNLF
ncbi:MAG: phage recombination protein Bet [Planctomycetota bacterium]|nr:phage recombination protein Bet [Planctomycetota bacterium]